MQKRNGFISVGANGQELISLMDRAWFFLRKLMIFTFSPISGIVSTARLRLGPRPDESPRRVRRGLDLATRRLYSSLRSHRPQRSLCRHACSGLNRSLPASVKRNPRGRNYYPLWLLVVLLLAGVMVISITPPAIALTGIQHYGYYLDDWGKTVTAAEADAIKTYTNTHTIMGVGPVLANVQMLRSRGMKAIIDMSGALSFGDGPTNSATWPGYMASLGTTLRNANVLDSVAAFSLVDEPYNRNWSVADLELATNLAKTEFPNIPVTTVFLGERVSNGVPANMDWISLEVYPGNDSIGPFWNRKNFPTDPQTARDIYNQEMNNVLNAIPGDASGKPIIIVGQAIHEGNSSGELTMPVLGGEGSGLDLDFLKDTYWATARDNPNVTGIMWFAYDRGGAEFTVDRPDLIAAHQKIGALAGIPEPATLCLLGIPCLLIFRRKSGRRSFLL